jgi:hypothetical protein
MKSYLSHFLLLLTILLRAEFFALDIALASYHSNLPNIAGTEWVHEGKISCEYQQVFLDSPKGTFSYSIPLTFHFTNTLSSKLLFFQEKLQLSDGYIFVSVGAKTFNIPHRNNDEEDPAFHLG